ncbi:uncharacterized protein PSFLO_07053 [Pseudozyma flocculosa]|uniref:Uncharacterized protein n=1 Tax=Pseudozyma flocculosa TaxID=84751 RepID=A0A5C3FDM8_9BASI|nr:uncharacterized protein PSFLO_07053 [Pseudozyma flocculosa]
MPGRGQSEKGNGLDLLYLLCCCSCTSAVPVVWEGRERRYYNSDEVTTSLLAAIHATLSEGKVDDHCISTQRPRRRPNGMDPPQHVALAARSHRYKHAQTLSHTTSTRHCMRPPAPMMLFDVASHQRRRAGQRRKSRRSVGKKSSRKERKKLAGPYGRQAGRRAGVCGESGGLGGEGGSEGGRKAQRPHLLPAAATTPAKKEAEAGIGRLPYSPAGGRATTHVGRRQSLIFARFSLLTPAASPAWPNVAGLRLERPASPSLYARPSVGLSTPQPRPSALAHLLAERPSSSSSSSSKVRRLPTPRHVSSAQRRSVQRGSMHSKLSSPDLPARALRAVVAVVAVVVVAASAAAAVGMNMYSTARP